MMLKHVHITVQIPQNRGTRIIAAKMKTFSYVFIVSLTFQLIKADMKSVFSECIGSKDIPSSEIALLMDFKAPETTNGQCMLSCVMTKLNYYNEDGSINKGKIEAMAQQYMKDDSMRARSMEIVDQCMKEQSGADVCAKGVSAYKCLTERHIAAGYKSVMESVLADKMAE